MDNCPGRWPTLSYSINLQLVKQLHFLSHKYSRHFYLCFVPRRSHFMGTNSHLSVRDECDILFKLCQVDISLPLFYKESSFPQWFFASRCNPSFLYLCVCFRLCFSIGTVQTSHLLRLASSVGTLPWSPSTQPPTLSSLNSTRTSLELASLS